MSNSEHEPSILALADLATPMSIRVAATLDLVEHTGHGGATVEELAFRTGTSVSALRQLLAHLVTVGVFALDGKSARYTPTGLGNQLSGDAPCGIKPLLDINSAGGRAELAFVDLLDTITTGNPAYQSRYGREFWSDIDAEPALRASFDAQMNWRFRNLATQIAGRFDWSRFSDIVDVGGGDGMLLAEILRAHPSVRGRLLDLPPTAAAATDRFASAGLTDRVSVVGGSFFDPIPTGADAYILSDILHDWDDEHALAILAGCARAAGSAGTVVIIEPIFKPSNGTSINLFMLMCFGGRERTIDELVDMAALCNLAIHSSGVVADGRTALEFHSRWPAL